METIYCSFSCRRIKGTNAGLFTVSLYLDLEGKRYIEGYTRKIKLWEDQQYVTAIQSLENALFFIWECQGRLQINRVILVTDNRILAGWIENPYRNKRYTDHVLKALYPYKIGGPREIFIPIGLTVSDKTTSFYALDKNDEAGNSEQDIWERCDTYKLVLKDQKRKTELDKLMESNI